MASALDSLLQRFPKLGSYSVPFFARALYEDNFENVKDEFATSQDYITWYYTRCFYCWFKGNTSYR